MPMIAPPAPDCYIETLRSRIVEGRTLSPDQYRPVVLPLQVTLGASRLIGSASFTIPSNQRFLVFQFMPHIVPVSVSAAADATSGVFNVGVPAAGDIVAGGTVEDRLLTKMMNCRINMAFVSYTYQLFPQLNFSLSDLSSAMGESPSLMDMPAILPQGTNIDLQVSLQDSSAAAVGADTEYGILLVGAYINVGN
jgi:hypothetical protein